MKNPAGQIATNPAGQIALNPAGQIALNPAIQIDSEVYIVSGGFIKGGFTGGVQGSAHYPTSQSALPLRRVALPLKFPPPPL